MKKIIACLMSFALLIGLTSITTMAEEGSIIEGDVVKVSPDSTNYYKYSVSDATNVQKIVADLMDNNTYYFVNYDVDGNGHLTVEDATLIQKHCADLELVSNPIDTTNNGNSVSKVAASYYNSKDSFRYFEHNIFSENEEGSCIVRDNVGNCLIDTISYTGFSMLGINYENSPYAKHTGAYASWNPLEEINDYDLSNWNYSDLAYKLYFAYETNPDGIMTEIKDYFKSNTKVVYEYGNDFIKSSLRPGDLVFFGNDSEVSHMGIISENIDWYFEAIDSDSVLSYSRVEDSSSSIVLVCRPNYVVEE